ncbi:MAG: HD domain-containing phosphohydrolase [Thiohalophilus sp.]|uniref:HD domain-containing phosphohydrolase n=1 Tax=Thiohalophilus sp. TaxID=3028392 RepID=UPI0028707298|nr:HD domain-containing phosphohydrolase [Thiohalophilus sp.]MDR9437625.1 HD domain-containing phosphohydrolase [Thiohalophilus sp.]
MRKRSIKFQVISALAVQFLVLLVVVSITLYQLNLRKHDYVILNLSGQLRVISQVMVSQSDNYLKQAPRSYEAYDRDLGLYRKDLRKQVNSYSKIIDAFKARSLSPDLVSGRSFSDTESASLGKVPSLLDGEEVIYCTWDAQSRSQLDETAAIWERFKTGLIAELGNPDEPRLEAAAKYIQFNQHDLVQASADLSLAFRLMMEKKLNEIRLLNQVSLGLSFLIALTILLILYRKIFRPVETTVQGFRRVAQGDLNFQVPIAEQNEIGRLSSMFNELTRRLAGIFRLSDRINQANNLDETLRFVFEEFGEFLPIDLVALLRTDQNRKAVLIDRVYTDGQNQIDEGARFDQVGCRCMQVFDEGKPLRIQGDDLQNAQSSDAMTIQLVAGGMQSLIFVPLTISGDEEMILVFGSRASDAYHEEHLELLENIAAQVSHGFEKTIGMESLVISAVEGLAKLAESRDPETGDHLFRMSRYSALIAEQMGHEVRYQSQINSAYVRDILRFAPMHDIGKVGVEDSILLKPGKLTDAERQAMQEHPVIGAEVLKHCEQQVNAVGHSIFRIGIEIAESHHERFDGDGYPYQLKEEAIPLSARIVAVADVFDALTSRRPYKQAWSIDEALELIRTESGKHFDPQVIVALERALPGIMQIYHKYKHV